MTNPCSVYAMAQDRVDELVKRYGEIKARQEHEAQELALIGAELLSLMEEEQTKTYEVQDGGKIYRATYVQTTRTDIDEKGLRADLGNELVDQYCTLVLDKKALETAMEDGYISPFIVGKHVTERKSKPSVRFSTRPAEDS